LGVKPVSLSGRKGEFLRFVLSLSDSLISEGKVDDSRFPVWVDERTVEVARSISKEVRSVRGIERSFGSSFLLSLRLLTFLPPQFAENTGDFVFNLAHNMGRWFASPHLPSEMGVLLGFLAYTPALFGETEDLSPHRNFPVAAGYCSAYDAAESVAEAVLSFSLFFSPHRSSAIESLPDSVLHLSLIHFLLRERLAEMGFDVGERRGLPRGLLKLLPPSWRWELRKTVVYRLSRFTKRLGSPTNSRSPVS
jgi:hypothetical protein